MGWIATFLLIAFGIMIGAALVSIWNARNEIGVRRREINPRISTLDLFELPESMRTPPKDPPAP